MALVPIEVRGRIDLVDRGAATGGSAEQQDRARASRLNDVMIVLERKRPELEAAIAARLAAASVGEAFDSATLSLDPNRPAFGVLARVKAGFARTLDDAAVRAAVETDVAAEVFAMIDRHAGSVARRRWQPSVTADYHRPERPGISGVLGRGRRRTLVMVVLVLVVVLAILSAISIAQPQQPG